MKRQHLLLSPLILLMLATLAARMPAHAEQFQLIDPPPGDVAYGIYISPYRASIDGVVTTVICDDFFDDTYADERWSTTRISGSAAPALLATTRMATLSNLSSDPVALARAYDAVAWLAVQLLTPGATVAERTLLSFALWDVFGRTRTPDAVQAYLASHGANPSYYTNQVQPKVQEAFASAASGLRSSLTIYTPNLSTRPTCGAGPCPTSPPQEFITVPEPGTPQILGFILFCVGAVVLVLARSRTMRLC